MKLVFTPNPNYIHKVLAVAHEVGVLDRLTFERQIPFNEDTGIWRYNPLGKVPMLVMDNGDPLYGGLVVCEYLDSLGKGGPRLFPTDRRRWKALRQMVTGDGIFDATTLVRVESWRPRETWHLDYMQRERRKVLGALRMLDEDAKNFDKEEFHIGHVCIAGGLSYLDHRNPFRESKIEPGDENFDWRANAPTLARWYENIVKRPSLAYRFDLPK